MAYTVTFTPASGTAWTPTSSTNGWVLSELEAHPAQPKYNFVEIPGANGALDLSRAVSGSIAYGQRTIRMVFGSNNTTTRAAAMTAASTIETKLNGKLFSSVACPLGTFANCEVAVTSVEFVGDTAIVEVTCLTSDTSPKTPN